MSYETARSHHVAEDPAGEKLSRALRSLPARIPPAGLTTSLRVIASRERQRFLERRTLPEAFANWYARTNVTAGQIMRSLVLPVAGGVFSAVILFSTWLVPTYPLHASGASGDVPTMLTTEATPDWMAARLLYEAAQEAAATRPPGGDAMVDVTVDDLGRVVDYTIRSGSQVLQDPGRRRRLDLLMFTRFTPATEFGRPMPSEVTLPVLSSQVDVKD